jgi:hypothetical protein
MDIVGQLPHHILESLGMKHFFCFDVVATFATFVNQIGIEDTYLLLTCH